ncbi:unnamed protein product, partial [Discosporangium mesarthrocarpum]
MYAFPDVEQDEARRAARCYRALRAVVKETERQIDYDTNAIELETPPLAKDGRDLDCKEDPRALIPQIHTVRFFALGSQLNIIRGLENQDFRFKTFYDLSGSGGQAGLAAALLHAWSGARCFESCSAKHKTALRLKRVVRQIVSHELLTNFRAWSIQDTNFIQADWIDGDVILFDATVFAPLDEGVVCGYLEGRARALQAGSYVILFTNCLKQLMTGGGLKLLYRQELPHTAGRLVSWLYKTILHSNDHRVG